MAELDRSRILAGLSHRRDYAGEIKALCAERPYVVFYGCGAILASCVDTWRDQVGLRIDFVCDSDPAKWGQEFCGAKCLTPGELVKIREQATIFVTVGQFSPVLEWLHAAGFPSVHLLYKYDLESCYDLAREAPEDVADSLIRARAILADDRSRAVFDVIVARVLGVDWELGMMATVCEPDQYFPKDIIQLTEHEVFVDVGAYDGDSIWDFVVRTRTAFDQIHAFELDAENFLRLQHNVAGMSGSERMKLYNLGAWSRETLVTYTAGQSQSAIHVERIGDSVGHCVALDDHLRDPRVSFIKMDIEGAEPMALRGCQRIIREQRPKLAICVYHKFGHLWSIPLYLKELVPEYRIYLRHHTPLEYETVCYAVAEEGG